MCKPIRWPLAVAALLSMAACGGGGGSGGSGGGATYDPNGTISLSGLAVTGTSAAVAGVAPISPGANGGQFTISFIASGTALPMYSAYVYVNADGAYPGNGTDYNIAINCGAATIGGSCAASVTVSCTFDNTNKITCANPIAGPQVRDISSFLSSGVPKAGYIVVRACNALSSACSTVNAPVEFQ